MNRDVPKLEPLGNGRKKPLGRGLVNQVRAAVKTYSAPKTWKGWVRDGAVSRWSFDFRPRDQRGCATGAKIDRAHGRGGGQYGNRRFGVPSILKFALRKHSVPATFYYVCRPCVRLL